MKNNFYIKKEPKHYLNIIKNLTNKHHSNSMKIFPQEDIQSTSSTKVNIENYSTNNKYNKSFQLNYNNYPLNDFSYNSSSSKNKERTNEDISSDYHNNSTEKNFRNKYNFKLYDYFVKNRRRINKKKIKHSYSYIDTEKIKDILQTKKNNDQLLLIKKQNNKINQMYNILESKDKEINILQNENNSLYKYKIALNKYENSLLKTKIDLKNVIQDLAKYKNAAKELQQELNMTKSENKNLYISNENMIKQIDILEKENDYLKNKNEELTDRISYLEEKNIVIQNEDLHMGKDIKKLNDINIGLNKLIKKKEEEILYLQKENTEYQNELRYLKKTDLTAEQKLNNLLHQNSELINVNNVLNNKYKNLKLNINDIFNNFIEQIMKLFNKNEEHIKQVLNNDNDFKILDQNILFNFELSNSNLSAIEEIPILTNIELVFNKIKKFIEINLENYQKLKVKFNDKINDYNKTLNYMNNNINSLNKELSLLKEKNIILTTQYENQNKISETTTINSNSNNNSIIGNQLYAKFNMIIDFINDFYKNILSNYNNISSKVISNGKIFLPKIESIKINDNGHNNNENNVKEIIIDAEKIFNNYYEYIIYLIEELHKINNIKKENNFLKNEKSEYILTVDKLKNEINNIKIDNQNQINNLKVKYDLNLKEQVKDIDDKNQNVIKNLNNLLKMKEEEIVNVNKNYTMLYTQYKQILKNKTILESKQ